MGRDIYHNGQWYNRDGSPYSYGIVRANTGVLVGDSHTSHWAFGNERYQQGWPFWMQTLSGHRVVIISDQSTSGTYLTEHGPAPNGAQQFAAAIASGAGNLFCSMGWNDNENGITFEEITAAWNRYIPAAVASGMRVWWVLQCPILSTWGGYSVARQALNMRLNAYARDFATAINNSYDREAVVVIDTFSVSVDPTSGVANIRNGAGGSQGNDHPNNVTSFYLGQKVAQAIMGPGGIPELPWFASSNADNYGYSNTLSNLYDNGLNINSAGGVATGLTMALVGGAAQVNSIGARADGFGNNQQQLITFAANNDAAHWNTSDIKSRIVTGDKIFAICSVEATAMTGLKNVRLSLAMNAVTSSLSSTWGQIDGTFDVVLPPEFTGGMYKTPELTYNAATMGALTGVSANLRYTSGIGGGGVNGGSGRISIRKVTSQ